MKQAKTNLIEIVKLLFPSFVSANIEPKQGYNGTPFLIDDGSKYWLKLVNSSQLEDILKNVERQALQDIKSPYIIELLDVKTKIINGQRYDGLLFRYIDGEDLSSIFAKKKSNKQPFSEDEVKKLLMDIGKGIQAISSKGWVHQDIKQKNIRYDKQNNHYVILDFGLAYYSRDFQSPTGKHNRDYTSSEQAYASVDRDKVPLITFRSDIAQLGQLAYELLTLKNPFKDDGQSKLNFQRITKGEYLPLKELNSAVSDDLVKIINTMLNPHPGDRYRSPEDFLCALEGKQYVQQSEFEKGVYFQVWRGPQGYKKNIEKVVNEIQGVVVSASQMPSDNSIDEVKEKGIKLIFDPETYLLTEDIHSSWHGGLSQWDWYVHPLKPDYFKQKTRITTFVSQIVQSQKDLGVDYVMPPYFNVANPDSEWRNL